MEGGHSLRRQKRGKDSEGRRGAQTQKVEGETAIPGDTLMLLLSVVLTKKSLRGTKAEKAFRTF